MTNLDIALRLINSEDKYGNTYFVHPNTNEIFLKPKDDLRLRNIGIVQEKNGAVQYIKHEEESQRFRATDAWSINWHVGSKVDVIFFKTKTDTYKISRINALRLGDFKHFKSSTEKKLYVPVKYWLKKSEVVK